VAAASHRDELLMLAGDANAEITSATPAQRAISPGRRSIDPFQISRCSS
jgi:hypothetical protein